MPFQTVVNAALAPAVEGDFATANPRVSMLAGPGQLVAAAAGVTVGRFAWVDTTYSFAANAGAGPPAGFVHRDGLGQSVITVFLAETGNVIPSGCEVTLHIAGDFWVRTSTVAVIGQKVFANNGTGAISTGVVGATIAGASETKWFVASAGGVGELIKMSSWTLG